MSYERKEWATAPHLRLSVPHQENFLWQHSVVPRCCAPAQQTLTREASCCHVSIHFCAQEKVILWKVINMPSQAVAGSLRLITPGQSRTNQPRLQRLGK